MVGIWRTLRMPGLYYAVLSDIPPPLIEKHIEADTGPRGSAERFIKGPHICMIATFRLEHPAHPVHMRSLEKRARPPTLPFQSRQGLLSWQPILCRVP
eukprot:343660-Chlamydomonas_euryale.AAC.7